MAVETYPYRDFLQDVISPVALHVLERLSPDIAEIYDLQELLDTPLPADAREEHQQRFTERLGRIVRLLPANVSPMPNEVFTAIEFLVYEIHGEPIRIGLAIARLEELSDRLREDPLLHSLVTGRAN